MQEQIVIIDELAHWVYEHSGYGSLMAWEEHGIDGQMQFRSEGEELYSKVIQSLASTPDGALLLSDEELKQTEDTIHLPNGVHEGNLTFALEQTKLLPLRKSQAVAKAQLAKVQPILSARVELAKQAGRQEVIEWIEAKLFRHAENSEFEQVWQTQKKVWGVVTTKCPLCGELSPNGEVHQWCANQEQAKADRVVKDA